jgi:hypothetical protein
MARGRAVEIVLDEREKCELTALTRKHGAPQAIAERARIVLAAANGLKNCGLAELIAEHVHARQPSCDMVFAPRIA